MIAHKISPKYDKLYEYVFCIDIKITDKVDKFNSYLNDTAINKILMKSFDDKEYINFDLNSKSISFFIIIERPIRLVKKRVNSKILNKLLYYKNGNITFSETYTITTSPYKYYFIENNLKMNNKFSDILTFFNTYCSSHYSTPVWHLRILLEGLERYKLNFTYSIT